MYTHRDGNVLFKQIKWKIKIIKTKTNNRYKVPFLALSCALNKKHTF